MSATTPRSKGARSYYALLAVMAQTGQAYDVLHRAGNCHDSRGAPEFILECHDALPAEPGSACSLLAVTEQLRARHLTGEPLHDQPSAQ